MAKKPAAAKVVKEEVAKPEEVVEQVVAKDLVAPSDAELVAGKSPTDQEAPPAAPEGADPEVPAVDPEESSEDEEEELVEAEEADEVACTVDSVAALRLSRM